MLIIAFTWLISISSHIFPHHLGTPQLPVLLPISNPGCLGPAVLLFHVKYGLNSSKPNNSVTVLKLKIHCDCNATLTILSLHLNMNQPDLHYGIHICIYAVVCVMCIYTHLYTILLSLTQPVFHFGKITVWGERKKSSQPPLTNWWCSMPTAHLCFMSTWCLCSIRHSRTSSASPSLFSSSFDRKLEQCQQYQSRRCFPQPANQSAVLFLLQFLSLFLILLHQKSSNLLVFLQRLHFQQLWNLSS